MSAAVLRLAAVPIERVDADVAVVPLFAGERPLRDTAGRIDWRLCGRLSHLFAARRLEGGPGEAVLLPGGGGVRAALVLGLGLGARPDAEASDRAPWPEWVRQALVRAADLGARRVVLGLPAFGATLAERLDALLEAAAAAAVTLEVDLAPEPGDRAETAEWLRRAAQRRLPAGVEVPRSGEPRIPHGGASPKPPVRSSHGSAGRFTR